MSETKDGGSAFPTKREFFAAMALQSVIQTGIEGTKADAAKRLGIPVEEYKPEIHWPKLCAREAFQFADAMIEESEKP